MTNVILAADLHCPCCGARNSLKGRTLRPGTGRWREDGIPLVTIRVVCDCCSFVFAAGQVLVGGAA